MGRKPQGPRPAGAKADGQRITLYHRQGSFGYCRAHCPAYFQRKKLPQAVAGHWFGNALQPHSFGAGYQPFFLFSRLDLCADRLCLLGSFIIALCIGEAIPNLQSILGALLLGFVAYGLSIVFYIYAQRELGAAKTSAYYAIAPFIGVALSLLIFMEMLSAGFMVALLVMIAGTYVVTVADHC